MRSLFLILWFPLALFSMDIMEEKKLDLGTYFDHKPLKYTLQFENLGTVKISDLSFTTSCGCTTLVPSAKSIPAGGKVIVSVLSDLTGKRGAITKDVVAKFKKDGKSYTREFTLNFKVRKDIKAHGTQKLLKDVLFNEKCGSCHAVPAKGKYGKDLFKAICIFCHGENAQGAFGISFTNVNYYKSFDKEKVRKVITHGMPQGEMPGFSKEHGGPLDHEQIESLIKFLDEKRIEITR